MMLFGISKQKTLYKWIYTGYITLEQLRFVYILWYIAPPPNGAEVLRTFCRSRLRCVRYGTVRCGTLRCVALRCVTGCWKLGFTPLLFSAKQQRVMCVRACAIGVRLPSPRALTSYIYINSEIAICSKHFVAFKMMFVLFFLVWPFLCTTLERGKIQLFCKKIT